MSSAEIDALVATIEALRGLVRRATDVGERERIDHLYWRARAERLESTLRAVRRTLGPDYKGPESMRAGVLERLFSDNI